MKKLFLLLTIWLLLAAVVQADDAPILLKNRTIREAPRAVAWSELADFAGRHVLLQFRQTPTLTERNMLARKGVNLLAAIPERAYLAAIEARDFSGEKAATPFRLIEALQPEDKMHPRLLGGDVDPYLYRDDGSLTLAVQFFADTDVARREALLMASGARVLEQQDSLNLAIVTVSALDDAYLLAETDGVRYVTLPEPAWGLFNDRARAMVGAETCWDPPYSVTGLGVPVLVFDGAVVKTVNGESFHPDLTGRLTVGRTGMPEFGIYHAMHVSCTVAGDGSMAGGTYAGMAPGAEIVTMAFTGTMVPTNYAFVHNAGNINSSYKQAIQEFDVRSANNSIGANLGSNRPLTSCDWMGEYTIAAQVIDDIVGGLHGRPISIVWAAGNEVGSGCQGTYYTIPPPSPSKNTISVGAVSSIDESIASFSSRGPTLDGRLRPDICAPGAEQGAKGTRSCAANLMGTAPIYQDMSGTSMASPVVTGSTALLLEHWDNVVGQGDLPPALMKALLIHGAKDLGNAGPDYTFGFGGLRIPASLDLITDGVYETLTLDQGEEYRAAFQTTGKGPLKITLVWIDPPGALEAERDLVNNLDLKLIGPNGGEIFPWLLDPLAPLQPAGRGVDVLNPVEQVYLAAPAVGVYEMVVTATEVPDGPQEAWFVYTGLEPTTLPDDDDDDETPDDDDSPDDDDTPADDDATDDAAADDDQSAEPDDDDDDNDSGGCGC